MNKYIAMGMLLFNQFAISQERHTNFDPSIHGFNFVNTFKNDMIKEFDIRTGGLCGGMVYAALDYYKANQTIPQQEHRPAVHTTLHDYIYSRQVNSLTENLDKWAELGVNPLGARNGEFFNWGLQAFNGGRIEELKASLNRGQPVPLGLWHADGYTGGDHQVLAIGYKMGRYKGDLKNNKEDFEIYIYDPNYPNETQTLKADPRSQTYYYTDHPKRWLTYFVDKKYHPKTPPSLKPINHLNDGKTRQLKLEITTGSDDLRGGNDNLDIEVHYFDKAMQRFSNVNKSRRWIDNYSQTIELNLRDAIEHKEISHIVFKTQFSGGMGGENWNINKIRIMATEGGKEIVLKTVKGNPWVRFTGQKHSQQINLNYRTATNVNTTLPRVNLSKPQHNRCHNSIQGKIAWDYKGNKQWGQANLDTLCGSNNQTDQPGKCFDTVMHGKVNWGGGTQWQWKNAIELCKGTYNANRTISCFKSKIKAKENWKSATALCQR